MEKEKEQIKPFLRWAGGKRWLIKHIKPYLPQNYNNYHEPFLGGASIFFFLNPKNNSFLSDTNEELINTYLQLRDHPYDIIEELSKMKNTAREYYAVREREYKTKMQKAVRFIYLNRTCFNGIYRVNKDGKFNVPYGHLNYTIGEENLLKISTVLERAEIFVGDFEASLMNINENDLIFLDPPYTVAHQKNGFIAYNKKLFNWTDQVRLSKIIETIINKRAKFILTNSAHYSIHNLYSHLGSESTIKRVTTVSGHTTSRHKIEEYLYTNCEVLENGK